VRLLVSNNSELLRHLATAPFRSIPMEILVVTGGLEAVEIAASERPVMALLDADMADLTGYEAARAIKHANEGCRVVLVLSGLINARQMHLVAESACDEVVTAPTAADHLYDLIAAQLNLPRRAAQRYEVDLEVVGRDGRRPIHGRVANLSVDGARLLLLDRVDEGATLRLEVRPEGEPPIEVDARVVWTQPRDGGSAAGVAFDDITPGARHDLARLTQWDIIQGADRTRVVLRGDITDAAPFDHLLPALVGKVDFDMSQVSYMNTLGVREWIDFLARAPIRGYEFHACSVPFILQASLVEGVLGQGRVVSFFAPYACQECEHREERLLQATAILQSGSRAAPVFGCSRCSGRLLLDDLPGRYLAFLRGARVA
jgi:CheY-like chemotaxis protein